MHADTSTMAMDVRVKYLEQLTKQLSEQVKVMKQLVSTEVADLKSVMQMQVAEVKQIVMHQDRVYQERIRRLETRIEQLSEFAMQMARATGNSGSLRDLPPELLGDAGSGGGGAASASPARGRNDDHDDEEGEETHGVESIKKKYAPKITAIYRFYTTSNIQVFHPAMTIAHFAKLCRDCGLNDFNSGTPTELLWMAVLRRLGGKRKRRIPSQLRNATTISTGKFTAKKSNSNSFAYERLDEIPADAFPEALYALALEKIGKNRIDMAPETMFETFLITDIFPNTDARMDSFHATAPMEASDRATVAAQSIAEYKTDAVKAVKNEYLARIRESFKQCLSAQDYRDESMNLDGFVEFVRRHDLMPLISKPDVRAIFLACAAIEKQKKPEAKPDTISVPSLVLAIYHLADRIYGDALYVDKYPTPESRVRKLLAKMYLLRE